MSPIIFSCHPGLGLWHWADGVIYKDKDEIKEDDDNDVDVENQFFQEEKASKEKDLCIQRRWGCSL